MAFDVFDHLEWDTFERCTQNIGFGTLGANMSSHAEVPIDHWLIPKPWFKRRLLWEGLGGAG